MGVVAGPGATNNALGVKATVSVVAAAGLTSPQTHRPTIGTMASPDLGRAYSIGAVGAFFDMTAATSFGVLATTGHAPLPNGISTFPSAVGVAFSVVTTPTIAAAGTGATGEEKAVVLAVWLVILVVQKIWAGDSRGVCFCVDGACWERSLALYWRQSNCLPPISNVNPPQTRICRFQ